MIRSLVALFLTIFLLSSQPHAAPASVQALLFPQNHCTAFSIAPHKWMTAGHCGSLGLTTDATILDEPAWVIFLNNENDLAIFESEAEAPALKLAKNEPRVGDIVSITGFPLEIGRVTTTGRIAALHRPIWHPILKGWMTSDILDITTAPGNSGSPVQNTHGDVVGVLWGGVQSHPLSISVPWSVLREVTRSFWAN